TAPLVLPGPDVCAAPSRVKMPSVRPAPAALITLRNVRRSKAPMRCSCSRSEFIVCSSSHIARCFFDCRTNTNVSRATTNIAAHRRVDIGIGGPFLFGEERGGGHDLPGLAIAALRHVELLPRRLQRRALARPQTFDRRDV